MNKFFKKKATSPLIHKEKDTHFSFTYNDNRLFYFVGQGQVVIHRTCQAWGKSCPLQWVDNSAPKDAAATFTRQEVKGLQTQSWLTHWRIWSGVTAMSAPCWCFKAQSEAQLEPCSKVQCQFSLLFVMFFAHNLEDLICLLYSYRYSRI